LRVDISMAVICYASDTIEYDRRTPELSNAPPRLKQDTNSVEKKTLKHLIFDLDVDLPAGACTRRHKSIINPSRWI